MLVLRAALRGSFPIALDGFGNPRLIT